jgi:hypothetical protein
MTKEERIRLAHGLFVESVIKPDSELRTLAHKQECYYELLEWRDKMLSYLEEERKKLK